MSNKSTKVEKQEDWVDYFMDNYEADKNGFIISGELISFHTLNILAPLMKEAFKYQVVTN